jgi:hypothetical protein
MLSAPTSTAPAALQPAHQCGVGARGGGLAFDLRARERGQAGNVEQVLHREGHAQQRQLAGARTVRRGQRGIDLRRAAQRALGQHGREGVDLAVGGVHALEAGLHQRGGAGGTGAHRLGHGVASRASKSAVLMLPSPAASTGEKVHGGFGRHRQRHGLDHRGKVGREREVAQHAGAVGGRQGQRERRGGGVDVAFDLGGCHAAAPAWGWLSMPYRRTSRWKMSRLSFFMATKLSVLSVSTVRGRASA